MRWRMPVDRSQPQALKGSPMEERYSCAVLAGSDRRRISNGRVNFRRPTTKGEAPERR